MPHSFNKIWIHAIWSTKQRIPLIHQNIEQKVHQFISEQLRERLPSKNHQRYARPYPLFIFTKPTKIYCRSYQTD